jgi:hypothetical protein
MPLDILNLSSNILYITIWALAFLAVFWLSLVVWTFRDICRRTRDPLARLLSILVVLVFFLPGLVLYLILRPSKTMEEEYQQTLEEEALLQAIEDSPLCPGCSRRVKEAWIVCPNCFTKLKKPCHQCSKLMELPWNLCPFCGTPAPGMRRENVSLDEAMSPIPVEETEPAIPSEATS